MTNTVSRVCGIPVGPEQRIGLVMRHLQQKRPAGAKPTDWGPNWPLKWTDTAVMLGAERIHAALQDVPIVYGAASKLVRTLQTLTTVAPKAVRIERLDGLTPPDYLNDKGTWDCLANLKGETAAEIAAAAPELFELCGSMMLKAVQKALMYDVMNAQVALLVSHNPLCEAALATFLGGVDKMPVPNFAKGDMVAFVYQSGAIVEAHYLPVPPAPPVPDQSAMQQALLDRLDE